jgi:hypothetical protein
MIVHDSGDSWQLVQQPHHGDLAGQIAAAWGNSDFAEPRRRDSLVDATTRHDDGWAVWERWPRLDPEGRPLRFFDVHILSHLAFYRAAITDIGSENPYGGLLIAMHGAGIYRGRYGAEPGMRNSWADDYGDEIDAFVAEVETSYPARMEAVGVSDAERWTDYHLLQAFDRLALYFSGLFPIGRDQVHTINHVPMDYDGVKTDLRITPLSDFAPHSPTHVRIEPFPFAESPASFTVERRVVPKQDWDTDRFRTTCLATPGETIEIVVER